jgi:uncharacterized membrane protein (UPF0182 family)
LHLLGGNRHLLLLLLACGVCLVWLAVKRRMLRQLLPACRLLLLLLGALLVNSLHALHKPIKE